MLFLVMVVKMYAIFSTDVEAINGKLNVREILQNLNYHDIIKSVNVFDNNLTD